MRGRGAAWVLALVLLAAVIFDVVSKRRSQAE